MSVRSTDENVTFFILSMKRDFFAQTRNLFEKGTSRTFGSLTLRQAQKIPELSGQRSIFYAVS
jgi:hypothetical protein